MRQPKVLVGGTGGLVIRRRRGQRVAAGFVRRAPVSVRRGALGVRRGALGARRNGEGDRRVRRPPRGGADGDAPTQEVGNRGRARARVEIEGEGEFEAEFDGEGEFEGAAPTPTEIDATDVTEEDAEVEEPDAADDAEADAGRARVLAVFATESRERVKTINRQLMALERGPDPTSRAGAGAVSELLRELHTLKGSSATVHETTVESLAHQLEALFGAVRDGVRNSMRPSSTSPTARWTPSRRPSTRRRAARRPTSTLRHGPRRFARRSDGRIRSPSPRARQPGRSARPPRCWEAAARRTRSGSR